MTVPLQLPPQVSPPGLTLDEGLPPQVRGATVWALPVLPAEDGGTPILGPGAEAVADALGVDLLAVLEATGATGAVGEVTPVPVVDDSDVELVLLVGLGGATVTDFRRAGATTARAVRDRDAVVSSLSALAGPDELEALVVGTLLGSFGFHWRSDGPQQRPVERVVLAGVAGEAYDAALARGVALGTAGWRARFLATVPSNLKDPAWLADQAEALAEEAGLAVTVWDEQQLAEEGFGGIVGVGQASASPPRLIRLDYVPSGLGRKARAALPTVVLVGKGITFDTGGLSIKPGESMRTMKRDMSGGAVVLATMAALADVGCPVKVVGLVPAAENAIGGNALRPGDVLRHYGGRTTEVTNTDAEGRLVLADALAYAVAEVEPDAIVDVATLTGAMKVALGLGTAGYFANHEGLADAVATASAASGEPLWRMPLHAGYEDRLASTVADADHAPTGGGGAITAALFLQHFTGDVPWAHLDVAPVGDTLE
ncbi:MAG TPA: leucyl aminopeptidase family protein, partial [Nocardioides sp.]